MDHVEGPIYIRIKECKISDTDSDKNKKMQ